MRALVAMSIFAFSIVVATSGTCQDASTDQIKIDSKPDDGKLIVTIGGQPFTEYVYRGYAKPILYPVYGPHQTPMTRNYPMVKDVDNEAHDHVHHKSLWYTHDAVNGVQFWMEDREDAKEPRAGKIVQTDMSINGATLTTKNSWNGPDGKPVCTDTRTITFAGNEKYRWIDFRMRWQASHGEVKLGDTKEGSMAIRTHPLLRLSNDEKRGNHTAKGQSINSEGIKGREMWGKRAKWVNYWAPVGDHTVGVAIFDHPSNPRHPTWWHARNYGLIGANPFGIHDFEKKPAGTGDMTIPADGTLTFRYRFVFHDGDHQSADIPAKYSEFAESK